MGRGIGVVGMVGSRRCRVIVGQGERHKDGIESGPTIRPLTPTTPYPPPLDPQSPYP